MRREFAQAIGELWRTIGQAFDLYLPEPHDMRGPGPKWQAKHANIKISN